MPGKRRRNRKRSNHQDHKLASVDRERASVYPETASVDRHTAFVDRVIASEDRETAFVDRETASVDRETAYVDRETASVDLAVYRETASIDRETASVDLAVYRETASVDLAVYRETASVDLAVYRETASIDRETASVDLAVDRETASVDLVVDRETASVDRETASVDLVVDRETASVDLVVDRGTASVDLVVDRETASVDRETASVDFSVDRVTEISFSVNRSVLAIFKEIAQKLNERQDRQGRLVRLSRDIALDSKRIIFMLLSHNPKESFEDILTEAKEWIQLIIDGPIISIGLELENCPAHLYSSAVTAGFQQFVEARTLLSLMTDRKIITYPEVQKEFDNFIIENGCHRPVFTRLSETDYMLGLADLTGELMRKAINSIKSGDREACFYDCQIVRDLYTGFLGIHGGRFLDQKMGTTLANLTKVEMAVYALRVQGGGSPAPMLPTPPASVEPVLSDDEGYYYDEDCAG